MSLDSRLRGNTDKYYRIVCSYQLVYYFFLLVVYVLFVLKEKIKNGFVEQERIKLYEEVSSSYDYYYDLVHYIRIVKVNTRIKMPTYEETTNRMGDYLNRQSVLTSNFKFFVLLCHDWISFIITSKNFITLSVIQ